MTADAVYVIPNIAVPGTAGSAGSWTGAYGQIRADYAFNDHLWAPSKSCILGSAAPSAALAGITATMSVSSLISDGEMRTDERSPSTTDVEGSA